MTFREGPLVLMTVFLLALLLPTLLDVPMVYSIALSPIFIIIVLAIPFYLYLGKIQCLTEFGAGTGVSRADNDLCESSAVKSHERSYGILAVAPSKLPLLPMA